MRSLLLIILLSTSAYSFEFEVSFHRNVKRKNKARLQKAVNTLNKVLSEIDFHQLVYSFGTINCLSKEEGDQTGLTTREEVIEYLESAKVKATFRMYSTLSWRTTAKRDGNVIRFNRMKMKRGNNALANTVFHELLHVAGFGHCNDNSRNDRTNNTIPYLLGDTIQSILDTDSN